jgi:PAS domain S-box-containing protein
MALYKASDIATELGQVGESSPGHTRLSLPHRVVMLLSGPLPRTVLAALLVAIGYALAARLGVALVLPGAHVSALWAPNALLLAALLLTRRQYWWVYLVVVLPAHLLALATVPGVLLTRALIQYVANCATAFVAAAALSAVVPGMRRIDSMRTVIAFIVLAAIVSPVLTSIPAAAAYYALNISGVFWLTAIGRTLTNSFAILTLVPLILHAATWLRQEEPTIRRVRAIETSLLVSSLAVAVALVIAAPEVLVQHYWTLLLVLFIVTLWAAVHFGVAGVSASSLVLGVLATLGMLQQPVLLVGHSPQESMVWLLLVVVCLSMTLLLLATALEETRNLQRAGTVRDAKLGTMFARSIVPTVIWRSDGSIADANPAFFQLTGYTPTELAGAALQVHHLIDTAGDGGLADSARAAATLDTGGAPVERKLVLRGGQRIPVLISGCRFPGSANEGTACMFDLSPLRRVESERQQTQSLYAAVLASLHDQIMVLDQSGVVIEANPAWRRFAETYGTRQWERAGIGAQFLTACSAAAREQAPVAQLLQAVRDVLAGLAVRRSMEFSSDAEGSLWYEVSVEPLRRPEGGAVITRTDITANKRAMTQAREQRQQLTHLGRAAVLGELSGAFAHELAQPLTAILGNAEAALQTVLRGEANSPEIEEILRDIIRDDVRAADVIQRLRSMLTQGETERQSVDLNQVVHEVLALAHSDLLTRNVSVVTQPCAPAPIVVADPVQLQQVLLNLAINACEAMSDKPPAERRLTITTRIVDGGAAVECSVSDRGGGVKPEYMERIFQPFVTTKKHGLGLGLAICRSIIEAHGGRLWAENVQDGAVFSFTARTGV